MPLVKLENINLRAIAAAVPEQKASTSEYDLIPLAERELFVKTTGIAERRVAPAHIATSDLCYESALAVLSALKWDTDSIDAVIMVTQSPDHFIPGSGVILQHRLGLKKSCIAFDINLGCSGYVYGLYVLGNLLSSGQITRGLLLVGDKSTLSTAYTDKSTYPLFGDAGSATALEFDKNAAPIFFNLHTDGAGKNAIMIEDGGARNGIKEDTFELKEIEPGIKRAKRHLRLDGIEIFNFALREVASDVNELHAFAEKNIQATDYFVFHQANKLINESVRKKLKIADKSKVPSSIEEFGNISSASIPLTIVSRLQEQISNSPTICLSGFGVGFSWASCIVQFENTLLCPLIQLK